MSVIRYNHSFLGMRPDAAGAFVAIADYESLLWAKATLQRELEDLQRIVAKTARTISENKPLTHDVANAIIQAKGGMR